MVTNRMKLMEDLKLLTAQQFEFAILSRRSDLPEHLEDLRCHDCKKLHGGCPNPPEDVPCPLSMAEWLEMPCTRFTLMDTVYVGGADA